MSETKGLAIYGAGGFAREVAWLVDSCGSSGPEYKVVCFIDDNPDNHGKSANGIPILSLDNARAQYSDVLLVAGIGSPRLREGAMTRARSIGFRFHSLIHPSTQLSRYVDISEGTIICAGCILTVNIRIGCHVQINLDCTIGHDAILEDYATLAPGVHVSGHVHIGKRSYIGTGASIINGTKGKPLFIGDDAIIGAGAVVTKSLEGGKTYAGVPARIISELAP